MEKKLRRIDLKKTDKSKEPSLGLSGTSLLNKVLEELDIKDLLSNRDRGDSKNYFGSKSTRNLDTENAFTQRSHKRRQKLEFSASEVKTKNDYVLDSDDSSKKYNWKIRNAEKSKLDVQNRAEQKCTFLEQLIKSKPEIERTDNTKRVEEKIRKIDENAKEEEKKTEKVKNIRLPPGRDLKYIERDSLERRKLLMQKYTVKLNSSSKNVQPKNSVNNDDVELEYFKEPVIEILDKETPNESPKDTLQLLETNKFSKKPKEQVQRKPIIKTIRKMDHRVYKAVTFTDRRETTPLQIKMPTSKKSVEINTLKKLRIVSSKISVDNKTKSEKSVKKAAREKKIKRLKKKPSSPALSTCQASPPTEVAKWAPSSITQHTKPYYEAWVDTTLAAISKCPEKEKLKYSKQQIYQTFKRAFELETRPSSPQLVYEKMKDEKFLGRITINKSK